MNHVAAAALALLITGPVPTFAAPASARRSWELSPFSWIKRLPAERGAPSNGHPLRVEAKELVQVLGTLQFVAGAAEEPLFAPAEAAALGKLLAEALAQAEPGEDLVLLSTSKRDTGMFGKSLSVTARIFAQDGKLNLIVHDTRLDFVDLYFIDFRMPTFNHGSRTAAGTVVLKAAGAELRRPDWIVLPLLAPVVAIVAAPPVAVQPASALPTSLEERLRGLKRLREQNLITEAEYAKKKQELLKDF
jgi:hypothetical protein